MPVTYMPSNHLCWRFVAGLELFAKGTIKNILQQHDHVQTHDMGHFRTRTQGWGLKIKDPILHARSRTQTNPPQNRLIEDSWKRHEKECCFHI